MKQPPKKVSGGLRYSAAAIAHFAESGVTAADMSKLGLIEYGPLQNPVFTWLKNISIGIPYTDPDNRSIEFMRFRILGEALDSEGKPLPKYLQEKGSGVFLYLPCLLQGGWRRVMDDPSVAVLITEGEKKAMAGCRLGYPTVAVAGVNSWSTGGRPLADWDNFTWPGRPVVIVFDSDAAAKRRVGLAAEHLAAELRRRGADVRITFCPPNGEEKVGLDDFIQQEPETAKERVEKLVREAQRHVLPELVLNEELAVVLHGSRALVLLEREQPRGQKQIALCRPQDLAPLYRNRVVRIPTDDARGWKSVPIFELWMESPFRRQYERVVMEPSGCAATEYNLWQGFSVDPRPGDCELFLQFLLEVICAGRREHYDYLLKWLAVMFQRPGEVPRVAVVLRGRQGTGKTTLADIIGGLISAHYVAVAATDQLAGKFNGLTDGAVFLFSDEAVHPEDKRSEGILKTLITGSYRTIERKGIDPVIVRNCAHVMFATNHDRAVAVERDDRRLFVLDVSDVHADDRAYFARLHAAMNEAGQAALLHYLLNYPADDFFELKPPKTLGLLEQKLLSLSSMEKFWLDCLVRGSISERGSWPATIRTADVLDAYANHAARLMHTQRGGQTALGIALDAFVPGLQRLKPSVGGSQLPHYGLPPLEVCRAAFARRFGDWVTWADFEAVLKIGSHGAPDDREGSSGDFWRLRQQQGAAPPDLAQIARHRDLGHGGQRLLVRRPRELRRGFELLI